MLIPPRAPLAAVLVVKAGGPITFVHPEVPSPTQGESQRKRERERESGRERERERGSFPDRVPKTRHSSEVA